MTTEELKSKIAKYNAVLEKTTDERERQVIINVINNIKAELEKSEKAQPADKPEPEKPSKAPKVRPKEKVTVAPKKKEPAKKEVKPAKKAVKKKVIIPRAKKVTEKEKPAPKVEKTVKVHKVIPEDEKKNVREILEKEHFKVTFKEVGGKKVKITVRHSDRTVAKNKVASAFNTIGKKVNSEEEKKKYSKDLQLLEMIQKTMEAIIEKIYKAFNAHDAKELSQIARKIKSI